MDDKRGKEKQEGRRRREEMERGREEKLLEERVEGRTQGREGGGREDCLPSVILSSEEEERMRKQEIGFKGRMKGGGNRERARK